MSFDGQLPLDLPARDSFSRDDLVVWQGNRLAFDYLLSFPDWSSPLCLIVGPPKSGKTHLAHIFANLSGALLIDSDTGTLSQLLAELLEEEKRPVVIDDIDRFETAERELFHLINASMRSGRPVLMTASGPVERWAFVTDDLKSRARLATRFELSEPDDVELTQIFVKLLADRQLSVDLSVVSYLMARMERSMQDVVGMVHLLDRLSLAKGRAITRALAAEALAMREQAPQNEETDDE
ncbi:MAG: hypothetical protein H6874_05110 [Hyphomicrobiaceae bacterium]|nr:hypothetical protein [Hyphomicrobiaceae bacterium]